MKEQDNYYRGVEELNQTPEFVQNANSEFPEYLPTSENEDSGTTSRRDFLKLMGFSVAAVSLAACETPTKYIIPYVNKPEGIEPGNALYYATSFVNGSEYASVLVRTREGRPILVEGNPSSSVTKGAVSSQGIASVLSLYDSSRAKDATKSGKVISMSLADAEIAKQLKSIASSKGQIRIVSETVLSPSANEVINKFKAKYPTAEHVVYDPSSSSALLYANDGFVPNYDFSKVDTVVSFNADFLGSYLNSSKYSVDFAKTRKLSRGKKAKSEMSKLFQFETIMSLTGANADTRTPIKPSEEAALILALHSSLSKKTDTGNETLDKAVNALKASKGKSIVLSSTNDKTIQTLVTDINRILKNEGSTINTKHRSKLKQGNDKSFIDFVVDLKNGNVDGVIFLNSNPAYNTPFGKDIKEGLKNVKLAVSTADRLDETASECTYNVPTTHYLESWGDAEPIEGHFSLIQPTIGKIFENTRCSEESLLAWTGIKKDYYTFVKDFWTSSILPLGNGSWNGALELGVYEPGKTLATASVQPTVEEGELAAVTVPSDIMTVSDAKNIIKKIETKTDSIELVIYEKVNQGVGHQANNPWGYENPDPISKVCWDNYLAINPATAESLDLKQGSLDDGTASDLVNVIIPNVGKVLLPIVVQPGQAENTVAIAYGFGRTKAGKLPEGAAEKHPNPSGGKVIGVDVFHFLPILDNNIINSVSGVKLQKTNKTYRIAQTQTHHTIMGRKIVQESDLATYKNQDKFTTSIENKYGIHIASSVGALKPNQVDIWKAPEKDEDGKVIPGEIKTHTYPNHHWGLVVDLNTCFGCGSCIASCHAENNVPVVGKDEILRKRDMHWLRIDRYYKSENEANLRDDSSFGALAEAEKPATHNPEVTFQPMMCQHCNHAPCETVCPVVATTHSSEGLNQMTYNRCIGTRYCANNCPYKVRRFNWFNYSDSKSNRQFKHVNVTTNDDLGKMVLNPDVTVRARGVMEKCSMCAQRIQSGKLKAKLEKRKVKDGDINPACTTTCPTDALTFGDMNDPNSRISQILSEENQDRSFHVLEELNVKPNISYLTKIRNKS